jgi:hypothetical protein
MDNNNIVDIELLKTTFENLGKTQQRRIEDDEEKIGKIGVLLSGRFDADHCRRVYIIVNAEYKILPGRNREMLESRIKAHFNNQISDQEVSKILNIIVFNLEEVSEETDFLAKQVHANMGLGGDTAQGDEVENPAGEFGYSVTNPIPVSGIDRIDDYFTTLKRITGESITYNRLGSLAAENLEFPVDKYEIFDSEKQFVATLYVYAYHGCMTGKAPRGFRLVE